MHQKAEKAVYASQLAAALSGFARAGTIIVLSIVITAVVNFVFIVEKPLSTLPGSDYGLLLLIKTVLFFLMLLLAAANRFRLTPRLETALLQGQYKMGIYLMRKSIITEFTVSVLILATVAWLGTLSPGTGME